VQHHHAHVAAVLAEHGEAGPVCGLAWDGTGWGDDGTIWGGECVRATCARMERRGALRAFALPGGDAAARQPCRVALGALHAVLGEAAFERTDVASVQAVSEADRRVLQQMLGRGVRSPLTSSMGRLFDVVASVLDVCQVASCEGEAAMRLEAVAGQGAPADDRGYGWAWDGAALDWGALLLAMIEDRRDGVPVPVLARSFHAAVARAAVAMAERVGLPVVVLGGGCFQNALLLALTVDALRAAGYRPLWPRQAPPNDGGLAYGQLVVAAAQRIEQGV
jgi:hydrogenase maturation protein HypF